MITVVVGLIGRDGDQLLLCQRKKSARYGLKWEFPGGKSESGEHLEDALRRELREELAIEATIGELYHRQSYVYPDSGSFDVHYYRVQHFTGTIMNQVFESVRWVAVNQLANYDILEGNADVVEKLLRDQANVAAENS